jgi:hypothetical protein
MSTNQPISAPEPTSESSGDGTAAKPTPSPQPTAHSSDNHDSWFKKRRIWLRQWLKKNWKESTAWLISVFISAAVLVTTWQFNSLQERQIAQLQRTTPTGQINTITAYHPGPGVPDAPITDVRNDPFIPQQIENISGQVWNVPDNGELFVDVHNYGERYQNQTETQSRYFLTLANIAYGTSDEAVTWKAPGVYFGGPGAPSSSTGYRLTLYFCNSVDSAQIDIVLNKKTHGIELDRNAGFASLPYPSCTQLDSIFVQRR